MGQPAGDNTTTLSIYDCLKQCIAIDTNNEDLEKSCMSECQPEKYTAPLMWVGFYIAGASLVCMIAMATDLFNGLRMKKAWFPCKYFTLNAAISAVLAIALKMPVDLSTSMPCGRDQLMKLSGTALMSVSMGNFMPSLAAMSDPELFANLMALALFIVPLISNICIQIGTEVIYQGIVVQHVIIISCIIFQFALLVSTAIASPAMKQQLDSAYKEKASTTTSEEDHRIIINNKEAAAAAAAAASSSSSSSEEEEHLKINKQVKKHWVMAQTGNPQFVIARSVMCTASGAICLVSVLVLAEAVVQLYITMSKPNNKIFFDPSSDYKWSANVIVLTQAGAVLVGSISPICRWLMVVWFKFEDWSNSSFKNLWRVEDYWTKRLHDLKDLNLELSPRHEKSNKFISEFISDGKPMFLDIFIKFQNFTVLTCRLVCLVSLVFLLPFMFVYKIICFHLKKKKKLVLSKKNNDENTWNPAWVLKLVNESKLPEKTINKIVSVFDGCINKGGKKKADLDQTTTTTTVDGFDGIKEFNGNLIERLTKMSINGISNNSNGVWSTRIVTLSTIACAIKAPAAAAAAAKEEDDKFVSMVTDTLQYVRYVEKALCAGRQVIDLGDAATDAWKKIKSDILRKESQSQRSPLNYKTKLENLKSKLSKEDTERKQSLEKKHTMERKRSLKRKQSLEKTRSLERKQSLEKKEQSSFAEWMKETVEIFIKNKQQEWDDDDDDDDEVTYEKMCKLVSDIIAACLVNLEKAITMNISNASIEKRESVVKDAAFLLGATEDIRRLANQRRSSVITASRDYAQASWWKVHLQHIPLEETIAREKSAPADKAAPAESEAAAAELKAAAEKASSSDDHRIDVKKD